MITAQSQENKILKMYSPENAFANKELIDEVKILTEAREDERRRGECGLCDENGKREEMCEECGGTGNMEVDCEHDDVY